MFASWHGASLTHSPLWHRVLRCYAVCHVERRCQCRVSRTVVSSSRLTRGPKHRSLMTKYRGRNVSSNIEICSQEMMLSVPHIRGRLGWLWGWRRERRNTPGQVRQVRWECELFHLRYVVSIPVLLSAQAYKYIHTACHSRKLVVVRRTPGAWCCTVIPCCLSDSGEQGSLGRRPRSRMLARRR